MHTHFSERPSHVRSFELVETTALRRRVEDAIEGLTEILQAFDAPAGDDQADAQEARSC